MERHTIIRYYNDNYGRLNPTTGQQVRGAIAVAIGIAVSFAALVLVTYAITVGLSAHQVVIWGGLLIAGALPVWDGGDPSNAGLAMAGVAAIACGVLDHRLFGAPAMAADAQA